LAKGIKIKIDKTKCIGCATCAALAFDVFTIGDEGVAEINPEYKEVLITDPEVIEQLKNVFSACPSEAITVEEF
jgi:ferredoxin